MHTSASSVDPSASVRASMIILDGIVPQRR
jgi:hypothetical protein